MRIVETEAFRKLAGSWDDQPGFKDRNMLPGGLGRNPGGPSEEDIIEDFDPKKRKKRKRKTKRIYQLGIDVPLTEREENKVLINL